MSKGGASEATQVEHLSVIILIILVMMILTMIIIDVKRTFSLAFLTRSLGETVSRQPPHRGPYNLSGIIS